MTAVISGVEPARSQFEKSLKRILSLIPGRHLMILGRPGSARSPWTEENIDFVPHLPQKEFAEAVAQSEWVVSRGGYTTIMDMAVLGAKCIVVPTPGQYEQVLLGDTLAKSKFVVHVPADKLNAKNLTAAFEKKVALPKPPQNSLLEDAVAATFKG